MKECVTCGQPTEGLAQRCSRCLDEYIYEEGLGETKRPQVAEVSPVWMAHPAEVAPAGAPTA